MYPFSLIDPDTLRLIAIGMFSIMGLFMALAHRIRGEAAYAWLAGGCLAFAIGWALNASEYVFGTNLWTVPLSHLFLLLLPISLICASISFLRLQSLGAALIISAPILVTTFFLLRVTMHHEIVPNALTSSLNGAMYLGTAWIFNRFAQPVNTVAKTIIAANMITGAAFITRTGVLLYGTLAPDAITPDVTAELLYTTLFINLMCALAQALCFPLLDFMRTEQELSLTNKHLAKLADRDHLTETFNRRAFLARLELELQYHQRKGLPLSLILFDIDHFKSVNDNHGHAAGDALIQTIVAVIRSHSRKTDILARYGGDEFTLTLPDTSLEEAILIAEKLRGRIADLQANGLVEGRSAPTTCSFGVASNCAAATDVNGLIAAADVALYEAKRLGRNRVHPPQPTEADLPSQPNQGPVRGWLAGAVMSGRKARSKAQRSEVAANDEAAG